jgi:hypothetical protein
MPLMDDKLIPRPVHHLLSGGLEGKATDHGLASEIFAQAIDGVSAKSAPSAPLLRDLADSRH